METRVQLPPLQLQKPNPNPNSNPGGRNRCGHGRGRCHFDTLPFDVLLAICHHVDLISRSRSQSSSSENAKVKMIGRRVVDTGALSNAAAAVAAASASASVGAEWWTTDALLVFSSVNKRIREAAEPILFESIVFGSKWESRGGGAQKWELAQERMMEMMEKQSLQILVKKFKFWSPTVVWDVGQLESLNEESTMQFWSLFVRLLRHLRNVHTVELAMVGHHRGSYYPDPLSSIHRGPAIALERRSMQRHRNGAENEMGALLFGCVPCYDQGGEYFELEENNALLSSSATAEPSRILFRNVKEIRITRSCQWFVKYCPNLESYVDNEGTLASSLLLHEFPQRWQSTIKTLRLREWATTHLISALAQFRNLEALGLEVIIPNHVDILTIVVRSNTLRTFHFLLNPSLFSKIEIVWPFSTASIVGIHQTFLL
ncbi:hypothetical protein FRB91_008086 [Serendipita sp. 411]|nr:hypothetical protein FRB91_008086 [Serendipita sp. 411]